MLLLGYSRAAAQGRFSSLGVCERAYDQPAFNPSHLLTTDDRGHGFPALKSCGDFLFALRPTPIVACAPSPSNIIIHSKVFLRLNNGREFPSTLSGARSRPGGLEVELKIHAAPMTARALRCIVRVYKYERVSAIVIK